MIINYSEWAGGRERGLPLLGDIISAYLFVSFSFGMQYMYIYMSMCVMVGWTMITFTFNNLRDTQCTYAHASFSILLVYY